MRLEVCTKPGMAPDQVAARREAGGHDLADALQPLGHTTMENVGAFAFCWRRISFTRSSRALRTASGTKPFLVLQGEPPCSRLAAHLEPPPASSSIPDDATCAWPTSPRNTNRAMPGFYNSPRGGAGQEGCCFSGAGFLPPTGSCRALRPRQTSRAHAVGRSIPFPVSKYSFLTLNAFVSARPSPRGSTKS